MVRNFSAVSVPRRSLLTATERQSLLAFPESKDELILHYTFSEPDLAVIRQHRGGQNRLGFAVQLCSLRYPGCALPTDGQPPEALLSFVSRQLRLNPELWPQYAQRAETRREHLLELQVWLGLEPFGAEHYRQLVDDLTDLAQQTDRGIVLMTALVEALRQQRVIVPLIDVLERVCAEALTRGTRRVYDTLTENLPASQIKQLNNLLEHRGKSKVSMLAWLRQPHGFPNPKHVLVHLDRLRVIRELGLLEGLERSVHQNRLLKLAREGGQMTAQHLRDLEPTRRHATVVAVVLDTQATLIDEIIDMHDRILGALFNRAKKCHAERFQWSGKDINHKLRLYTRIGRALLEAKEKGSDPFAAIETVLPWEQFTESITEAEKLTQPADFDYLPLIGEGFTQLRRYTPTLLESLQLKAAPAAQEILSGVATLKAMNERQARKVPDDAPTGFVRKRWKSLVEADDGLDRRFYEICVLSELRNGLRSGDIWVQGSRQFKDFEEYLLPPARFSAQREQLGLAVDTDCERYLEGRLTLLKKQLAKVERLAAQNELPDATITASGLKITPLVNAVPDEAETLMRQAYALLPHPKITDLLLEVDSWTGFTNHFTHLKNNEPVTDKKLLLAAILADAINLGLTKMAESCPGITYAKLSWLQAWHIRDETYSAALAELVNAQSQQPFATWWGEGTTSSSDGQWFRAGGTGQAASHFNAKYGNEPGVTFYTHISDRYSPFHTKVISVPVRDATHVLDGLLYHESELHIKEHYTDTAGFTDHVFGLMHLLGFRFAPRIKGLKDKNLFVAGDPKAYPTLGTAGLLGDSINVRLICAHWDQILRLAASIKQGTVTASLMLRKLGSYPRQNGLALALRELGRIERTLFALDWIQSVELRRRVQIGLNKGEAKNGLSKAVFFNRLGELRDRSFENQRYRASGLNLVVAAIVLWNTVYLERAVQGLKDHGVAVDDSLLAHLSPLGWEHINLTGDYVWKPSKVQPGKFRPLRPFVNP
jgi:TnpA family transposase